MKEPQTQADQNKSATQNKISDSSAETGETGARGQSSRQSSGQSGGQNGASEAAQDFSGVKSLDDALRVLDNAIATGRSGLKELVTEEYRNLKEAIGEIAPELRSAVGAMGQDAFSKVSDMTSGIASDVASIGKKSKDYAWIGMQKGRTVAREVDEKVHGNPWFVIGGVALGAFALGFFLGGRDAIAKPRSSALESPDLDDSSDAKEDAAEVQEPPKRRGHARMDSSAQTVTTDETPRKSRGNNRVQETQE